MGLPPLLPLLVALLPIGFLAPGIRSSEGPVDTYHIDATAPSGKYLDHVTSIVHLYDAGTGALTPTSETAPIVLYAEIDAYKRGERASLQAPTGRHAEHPECASSICVSAFVAMVGSHDVKVKLNVIPNLCAPRSYVYGLGGAAAGPVTFRDSYFGLSPCGPGTTTAHLYLGEEEVASDFTTY